MNPSQRPPRTEDVTPASAAEPFDALSLRADEVPVSAFLDPPRAEGELGWFVHYRVVRRLGDGSMGIVLLAEDTHLRRPVALKLMHPRLVGDDMSRRRFLREARAMAAIDDEHVVRIFQVGAIKSGGSAVDMPFLAMQYLQGETLHARLARERALPPGEVMRIGREIALGLAAAHAQGLIHRDIKPANIWLETISDGGPRIADVKGRDAGAVLQDPALANPKSEIRNPKFRVKILDFGLAFVVDAASKISTSGMIVGTPYFMAPEQAQGDAIDARSDLFSLGCVLYAALSGAVPFEGKSALAVMKKLTSEVAAPLAERAPQTPPRLARLVERLMAKSPAERPQTAAEVAAAIARIEGEATAGASSDIHDVSPPRPSAADTVSGADTGKLLRVPRPERPTFFARVRQAVASALGRRRD